MNISLTTQIYNNYNNYNNYKPVFRANGRKGFFEDSLYLQSYRTYTKFFRSDLNWKDFARLIEKKYKKADKINIIDHACSNGSEPTSLLLSLLTFTNIPFSEKIGKIMAYDYDKDNITLAKANYMDASTQDIYEIGKQLNCQTTDFFDIVVPLEDEINDKDFPFDAATHGRYASLKHIKFLRAKPEIQKKIEYHQGDILEDIDKIPDKNTILMCRNFWPYLSIEQQSLLMHKLSKKFDSSSLIVIGVFDKEQYIDKVLESHGFMETKVKNVFVKTNPIKRFLHKIKLV